MKTHALLALAILFAGASAASAQTLDECLALAHTHAPRLKLAEAGVSRAEQAIREARAALSPTLRLGGGFTQFTEPPPQIAVHRVLLGEAFLVRGELLGEHVPGQPVGRLAVVGDGFTGDDEPCDGLTHSWTTVVVPSN